MQLKNRTEWEDKFLRRMVSWCGQELGTPARLIRIAQFGQRSNRAYSGRAFYSQRRILVRIGPASRYPLQPDRRPGMCNVALADRLEALVAVTAHEIYHLAAFYDRAHKQTNGRRTSSEKTTRWFEAHVLLSFREKRAFLIEQWAAAGDADLVAPKKKSVVELRAELATRMLSKWERKLKLAKTKVAAYRRKVRYYDKRQAANNSEFDRNP